MFLRKLLKPAIQVCSSKLYCNLMRTPHFFFTINHKAKIDSLKEDLMKVQKQKGQLSEDYGIKVLELASIYKNAGQTQKALQSYLMWLQFVKQRAGAEHPFYIENLRKIANQCIQLKQFGKALELLFTIRNLQEKIEQLSLQHATTTYFIGLMFITMKNLEQCEKWFQQSMQIAIEVEGKKKLYLFPLMQLASVKLKKKEYNSSQQKYEEAIEILLEQKTRGQTTPGAEQCFFELANIYLYFEKTEKAKNLIKKLQKFVDFSQMRDVINFINKMNQFYTQLNFPLQVVSIFDKTLEQVKKIQGKKETYAKLLTSVATPCIRGKQYQKATKYLKEAKQIYVSLGKMETRQYALIFYSFGSIKFEQGKYEEAIKQFEESLRIWALDKEEKGSQFEATIKIMAGKAYLRNSNIEMTMKYFKEALQIQEKKRNYQAIYFLNTQLIKIYYVLKDFQTALHYALRNDYYLQNFYKVHKDNERQLIIVIAQLYLELKLFKQGFPYMQREYKLIENVPKVDLKWISYYQRRGDYNELMGNIDEAIECYGKVIEIVELLGSKTPQRERELAEILKRRKEKLLKNKN